MKIADLLKLIKRPAADQLILGLVTRPCERCKRPTFWSKPRQTVNGYCLDHAVASEINLGQAVRTVLTTFEVAGIEVAEPEIFAPDVYGFTPARLLMRGRWLISGKPYWVGAIGRPLDAGPCEGCRHTIRRYGPLAYPYCTDCVKKRGKV